MLELELYAAGLGDLDKILELDHQLAAIPGLRYKVDRNHNLVYLELDQTHHHLSRDSRDLSQTRARSAFHRPNSGRISPKNKNAAAGCLNTTANVRSIL